MAARLIQSLDPDLHVLLTNLADSATETKFRALLHNHVPVADEKLLLSMLSRALPGAINLFKCLRTVLSILAYINNPRDMVSNWP